MNPNQEYYDPEMEQAGRQGDGMVLLRRPFKPLRNTKTGNFFSYSFAIVNRNKSPNASNNIVWIHAAPEAIQKRIDHVKRMHEELTHLHDELVQAMKDEYKPGIRKAKQAIKDQTMLIDEYIYPKSEHKYVESKEHRRFRLEQQNELTLDAASIAALRGDAMAPVGSTADASLAQAKLEVAEARIKKLEDEAKSAKMDAMNIELPEKPAPRSRPKAAVKPK